MDEDQARIILRRTNWHWEVGTKFLLLSSHDELLEDMESDPVDGVSLDELEQALNYVRRDPRWAE